MGLLKDLRKRSSEQQEESSQPNNAIIGMMNKVDFPSIFFQGYTSLDKHPEFVAGVDRLADLISNMTILLMSKDDKGHEVRVRDGLARKLDINPNEWMTRKSLINYIVRNLMLYGNQVTVPTFTREGYLDNLIPVPDGSVTLNMKPVGYTIAIGDKEHNPSNVLHFVLNPDPNRPYIGLGHRIVLKDILDNLSTATQTKKAYMSQKYSPSMVIAVQADGSSDDWPSTRRAILEDYVESDKAGAPMIVPATMMEIESVRPLTLKDLAINEAVQIDKKTVAAILGIPAFILGVGDFNRDEYNNFIETKVKSIATILQQEMTKKLILSENMFIRFNHHSLLDYSLTDWATIGKNLRAIGVMTGNEVRNKVGLEFNDTPELNELVMLENYLKVEDIGNQKKLEKGGD